VDIQVIGDEIVFEGLVVGMLAQSGIPLSVMDRALEAFGTKATREDQINELLEECPCKHLKECPLHRAETGTQRAELEEDDRQALLDLMGRRARSGLLRLSDVADVINTYMDGEMGP
jgi:hypothetical protein